MNLSTYSQEFTQQSFEFKDWKKCFEVYFKNHELHGDNIQFVVSYGSYNSGYWIEKRGTELGDSAKVYNHKQVIRLKARIKKEITKAENEGRSPKFIS